MIEAIRKDFRIQIAVVFFILYTLWFMFFQLPGVEDEFHYDWFTVTYGAVAAWGGIWGLFIAKKWGGFKSVIGKSIIFFSLGLLFQEIGQLLYTYYIYFLNIELPFPSIGDYFFWGTIPLYIAGIIYLSQVAGVHISLRSLAGKLQAVLIPAIILLICYGVFLQEYVFDWSNPVKIAIDLLVPIGEGVYISLAILTYTLTRGVLGGMMKGTVLFILIALFAEFMADWVFLYQASRGTWSVSGINDYMYFVAYFLMAVGLLRFDQIFKILRENN